ncbi:Long chain acyl-CoA synthetase 7, peroxisomal, partial [Zancudomyces culisetae]
MAVNNKLKLVSHTVPNSAAPGYSHILESIELDDPALREKYEKHAGANTVYEVFWNAVKKYPTNKYLGCRPFNRATNMFENYVFITYEQAGAIVNDLASGIIHVLSLHFDLSSPTHKKLIENRNFGVGIYADNRMEWALAERASITQSLFSVALYDTLGASSVEYIINHSELPIIFCSLSKIPKILEMVDRLPTLKVIVSMDNFSNFEGSAVSTNKNNEDEIGHVISGFSPDSIEILKQWAASKSIGLYDFKELRKVGKSNPRPHVPPKPEDSYTLCYTSGTTGNPKGAICTHINYAFSAVYGSNYFPENENEIPIVFSYLPLAHTYAKCAENIFTNMGGIIGYYCGDVSKILEDCQLLKPTLFTGVPRILSRLYAGLAATTIDSPDPQVRQIGRIAVEEKIKNLKDGKGLVHKVWDEKIFNKAKAILGGNVRRIYSGSAPLEPYVSDFLKVVLITEILEGYGLTETASVVTGQMAGVVTSGDIGSPKPKMQARLRDAPEMEYLTTDKPCPRGELLIRGP